MLIVSKNIRIRQGYFVWYIIFWFLSWTGRINIVYISGYQSQVRCQFF